MTTPPLDLPALRKIANAALPGPWERLDIVDVDEVGVTNLAHVLASEQEAEETVDAVVMNATREDAAHIAAFDPPTVLHLIDSLEYEREATSGFCADRNLWRARAEAAEKKVAKVREIAHRLHSDYYLADVITQSIDHADNIANELDAALDTPETETAP